MQVSLDYQVSLESLDHSCLSRGECRRFGLPRCATCAIELHEGLETLAPLQPPSRIRRENPAAGIAKKELSRGEASDSEVKAVRREWNAWRTELEQVWSEEIAKVVRELGSAWRQESTANPDQVRGTRSAW